MIHVPLKKSYETLAGLVLGMRISSSFVMTEEMEAVSVELLQRIFKKLLSEKGHSALLHFC